MPALSGSILAGFWPRAIAFTVDFVIAGTLFLGVFAVFLLIASKGGWHLKTEVKGPLAHQEAASGHSSAQESDIELNFFHNWYSVVYLVTFFGLPTYVERARLWERN